VRVTPSSLYLQQLKDRKGDAALAAIGYGPTTSKLSISSVTASATTGSYVPANTIDGNLGTRWTSSGDGQWIRYDLGSSKTVSYVKVAFYAGDTRTYYFDVQTSTDGSTWTNVVTNRTSSATTALQTVDFTDRTARYVRIVGHVGTHDNYNNITETEIWGN
jgi:poly(beta-D-mannuronate) lyase